MLRIRALRAELNAALQSCNTVAEIQAGGAAFERNYGQSVWGCATIYWNETFADLYNAHLSRCIENEEIKAENEHRWLGIHHEISNCGNLSTFASIKAFVERMPEDAQVLWELEEKGRELMHPEYMCEEPV